MPQIITLRGQEIQLGDLTAATLEDFPDDCKAFFTVDDSSNVTGPQLRAVITLGCEAVKRGSRAEMTRENFREMVQLPDLAALYVAVAKCMGLGRGGDAKGEGQGPAGSQTTGTSSGA